MSTICLFRKKVCDYIAVRSLFNKRDGLLVALSGGADSVALLRVLLSADYHVEAAHCNFHLRGEESDRDEIFVRELCQTYGIKLHVIHFDTQVWAKEHHCSIEMAARELRYDWFGKLCSEQNLQYVAVAHHQDDSVETCLLNLIRGTGIEGLRGISPKNGIVVRPLLSVTRDEILEYLEALEQSYVTDSTNLTDTYTRNKIRLNLLPQMAEINPSVRQSIADTAEHLAEVAEIYSRWAKEAISRVTGNNGSEVFINSLLAEESPKLVLFNLFHPLGFTSSQLDDIYKSLDGESGRRFLSKNWEVLKDRNSLYIRSRERMESGDTEENTQQTEIPAISEDGCRILIGSGEISLNLYPLTSDTLLRCGKNEALLDADLVQFPLIIRKVQAGDRFVPFGMRGGKLVSDYMTDCKFNRFKKEQQSVLCDSSGRILWLIGERSDNRFRLTKGKSTRVLKLEWSLSEDNNK